MDEVYNLLRKVADTDSTILIQGESGTGKELVARALHFNSNRQHLPFVAINCSALPENLLESELFGHKKGAFTGAVSDKVGLFEEAEGGTIFLDEVNSMARSHDLPRELTIISLEASSEKAGLATMGDGVIVRVGDRTAVFDNATSALLSDLAREQEISFQRRLMSGGTCEATAFQLYGWRTAGLCVALGNYHNCGPETTIAAEFISVDDALAMTELCIAAAQMREAPAASQDLLRMRLEHEWEQHRPFFRPLAER